MIVVDSSVWIAFLRQQSDPAVETFLSLPDKSEVLVGDIVLMEVLQGARDERHATRLENFLRQFVVVPMLGDALARRCAHHYRTLRGSGVTVKKAPDLIIATYCIVGSHTLLHRDRDFDVFVKHFGLRCL